MPFVPASVLREIFTDFLEIEAKNFSKEQIQSIDNSILQSAANLQALREMPKDFQDEYIARNFGELTAPDLPPPAQTIDTPTPLNPPAQDTHPLKSRVGGQESAQGGGIIATPTPLAQSTPQPAAQVADDLTAPLVLTKAEKDEILATPSDELRQRLKFIETAQKGETNQETLDFYRAGMDFINQTLATREGQNIAPAVKPAAQITTTTPAPAQPTESLFARAIKEREAQIAADEAKLEAMEKAQQIRAKEYMEKVNRLAEQKKALAGLAANERVLTQSPPINKKIVQNAPDSSISLNDSSIIPLDFVVVKKSDVKPEFNFTGLQGRTRDPRASRQIIDNIANNFDDKLIFGRGGFDDLPIITPSGNVISGNHRVQAFLEFNPQSADSYKSAVNRNYNIDLADDELLLRMPRGEFDAQKYINLALASNEKRLDNLGDKALADLGAFAENIKDLPPYIVSKNVDELAAMVASILDKSPQKNVEGANLALFSSMATNSNGRNIAEVLNALQSSKTLDLEQITKIKDAFIKNAGNFWNLSNSNGDLGLKSLDLRPYLLDSIAGTIKSFDFASRAEHYANINARINALLRETDKSGSNALLDIIFKENDKSIFDNIKSEIMGARLGGIMRQENAPAQLYELLTNAKNGMDEIFAPNLINPNGKPLADLDFYDFLIYILGTGKPSRQSSDLIDLLPLLREKENAYKAALAKKGAGSTANAPQTAPAQKAETAPDKNAQKVAESTQEIPQVLQEAWLKEFGLKSIDEDYIVPFSEEIAGILQKERVSSVKITQGSLKKLIAENRTKYIDRIKPTLLEPDRIIKQDDSVFIFAKDFGEVKYFTSIVKDQNGEWIISSNAPKSHNGLENKIKNGGVEIYNKNQASAQINASTPYDDTAKSSIKLDEDIIPQETINARNKLIQWANGETKRREWNNENILSAIMPYDKKDLERLDSNLISKLYKEGNDDLALEFQQGEAALKNLARGFEVSEADMFKGFKALYALNPSAANKANFEFFRDINLIAKDLQIKDEQAQLDKLLAAKAHAEQNIAKGYQPSKAEKETMQTLNDRIKSKKSLIEIYQKERDYLLETPAPRHTERSEVSKSAEAQFEFLPKISKDNHSFLSVNEIDISSFDNFAKYADIMHLPLDNLTQAQQRKAHAFMKKNLKAIEC